MNIKTYIYCTLIVFLTACSSDERPDSGLSATETVMLRFRLSGHIAGTRAAGDETIRAEEGEVRTLTYAVFQNQQYKAGGSINFTQEDLQRGNEYYVTNLNKQDFGVGTEVFAIANASQEMLSKLREAPNTEQYDYWKNLLCDENLNTTAARSASRRVDNPLMAGYLALTGAPASIITVPVEHVYCRIWFRFAYVGESESLDMGVTSITVTGLPQQTRIFNLSTDPADINIADAATDENACASIKQEDTGQCPFFGDLTQQTAHRTDENGKLIPLTFNPAYPGYQTVCRYPISEAETDADEEAQPDFNIASPLRYYLYSYQWAGKTITDDPFITVTYSFPVGDGSKIVTKTAKAHLYDESHASGKQHHGLLRNYTYEVVCQINAASDDLTLQVTSQDWYQAHVTDIPSFD